MAFYFQELLESDNYAQFEQFFRHMFEIARRHKIMNPEKMRSEYGKLIYLLQDAVSPSVRPHLLFSCKVCWRCFRNKPCCRPIADYFVELIRIPREE